jgi:hypothetical protein
VATPEWQSEPTRRAAAASADALGDAATAACVRAKASPKLRKASMLALVRLWGYRCDVFRPETYSRSARGAAQAQHTIHKTKQCMRYNEP